jgi:hypothetical protein
MHIGDSAGQNAMLDMAPLRDALCLEPGIERIEIGKLGIGCHSRRRASWTFFST